MTPTARPAARLVDERALVGLGLHLRELAPGTDQVVYDLSMEAVSDRGSFERPLLVLKGLREPLASMHHLQKALIDIARGHTRACQFETFEPGLSLNLEVDEDPERIRVEAWCDLHRASRALRIHGGWKGQREVGLRLITRPDALERFRLEIEAHVRDLLC